MKRFLSVILVLTLLPTALFLTACNNKKPVDEPTATDVPAAFLGNIDEVLDLIVNKAIELDADKEYSIGEISCYHSPIDADNCEDVLGLTPDEFTQYVDAAMESKPSDSWQTHSIVIVKLKDGTDVKAIAEKMTAGTSPCRFGCLRVEAIVGGYAGNYVVLGATSQTGCDAVFAAFSQLAAVPATRIDRTNDWSDNSFFG